MIKPVSADMAGEKTITQWLPSYFQGAFFYVLLQNEEN